MAYKRPDQNAPEDPVLDVISEILSSGRTGWLYKDMVRDQKIALAAVAQPNFPGTKYPGAVPVLRRAQYGQDRGREREGAGSDH